VNVLAPKMLSSQHPAQGMGCEATSGVSFHSQPCKFPTRAESPPAMGSFMQQSCAKSMSSANLQYSTDSGQSFVPRIDRSSSVAGSPFIFSQAVPGEIPGNSEHVRSPERLYEVQSSLDHSNGLRSSTSQFISGLSSLGALDLSSRSSPSKLPANAEVHTRCLHPSEALRSHCSAAVHTSDMDFVQCESTVKADDIWELNSLAFLMLNDLENALQKAQGLAKLSRRKPEDVRATEFQRLSPRLGASAREVDVASAPGSCGSQGTESELRQTIRCLWRAQQELVVEAHARACSWRPWRRRPCTGGQSRSGLPIACPANATSAPVDSRSHR